MARQKKTQQSIKAIQTRYDNYHFRSRLEARWAVFFNAVGLAYEYEKEGYTINGKSYLPDFYLPSLKTFFEVKGQFPTDEEINLFMQFREVSESKFLCAWGNIGQPSEHNMIAEFYGGEDDFINDLKWSECHVCGQVGITIMGGTQGFPCKCLPRFISVFGAVWRSPQGHPIQGITDGLVINYPSKRLDDAFNRAREARFEHGELPSTEPLPFEGRWEGKW